MKKKITVYCIEIGSIAHLKFILFTILFMFELLSHLFNRLK